MTTFSDSTAANQLYNVVRLLAGDELPDEPADLDEPQAGAQQMAGRSSSEFATTSGFGGERNHGGLDIGTPVGTALISPFAGTVTHAGDDDPGGYGSWVEITSDDGTVVRYGHLSGVNVSSGQRVNAGTMIGATGGQAGAPGAGNSDGPHLHFEVRVGGNPVDPTPYLAGGWTIFGGG